MTSHHLIRILTFLIGIYLASSVDPHEHKKVSVTEVVFDSPVEDIQWMHHDHRVVLVRTTKGHLFRSMDYGKTWQEFTDILNQNHDDRLDHPTTAESIIVNPNDKNVIFIAATNHKHFISDDGSMTFHLIRTPHTSVHNWIYHPKHPRWALFSTWTKACTKFNRDPDDDEHCNHKLYFTKDLGHTHELIVSYAVQYSWGDVKHGTEDRIYFTHHRNKSGHQSRTGGWMNTVDFGYTEYPGSKIHDLIQMGNKYLISNGYMFVAKLDDILSQSVSLHVSVDGGHTFKISQLPTTLKQKSYTILDTSEGAVVIHVNHGNDQMTNTGNVYISDADGLRYSLSLPNNIRMHNGECEFDKVTSLDGVYIANFKDERVTPASHDKPSPIYSHNSKLTDNESWSESSDLSTSDSEIDLSELERQIQEETEAMETNVDMKRRKPGKSETVIRTVISFDKGGVWRYLNPPTVDSVGHKITCADHTHCYLHLHGVTNFDHYAPFYSVENAPGIVMGTGNVGSHLRYEEEEINTYLSRDGGLTWVEAHKGAFIYEFADHGGLVVMGDDRKKTNQVVFSWNEGQSWYDFDLGDDPVSIDNIVTDPTSGGVVLLLYGTRDSVGVLFHMDFSTLQQPSCKGVWAADSVSSDYETWQPTDGQSSDNCILGHQITITRRKQTSECFNGKFFDRPVVKKNCVCTEEDYECDFGFTRDIDSFECRPDHDSHQIVKPHCRSGGYYEASAYRKIPGDTCVSGWVPKTLQFPCPPHSPMSTGAKVVLGVMLAVVVFLGGSTYVQTNVQLSSLFVNYGFDTFRSVRYNMLSSKAEKDGYVFGYDKTENDNMEDEEILKSSDEQNRGSSMHTYGKLGNSLGKRRTKSKKSGEGKKKKNEMMAPTLTSGKNTDLNFIDDAMESRGEVPTLVNFKYSHYEEPDLLSGPDPNKSSNSRESGTSSTIVPKLDPPPAASSNSVQMQNMKKM